jgi:hypothetical protein
MRKTRRRTITIMIKKFDVPLVNAAPNRGIIIQ